MLPLNFHRSWKNKSHLSPLKDLLRCLKPGCLEPNDAGVAYTNFTELQCFKDDSQVSEAEKKPDSVNVLTDMSLQRSETGSKWVLNLCGNAHKL